MVWASWLVNWVWTLKRLGLVKHFKLNITFSPDSNLCYTLQGIILTQCVTVHCSWQLIQRHQVDMTSWRVCHHPQWICHITANNIIFIQMGKRKHVYTAATADAWWHVGCGCDIFSFLLRFHWMSAAVLHNPLLYCFNSIKIKLSWLLSEQYEQPEQRPLSFLTFHFLSPPPLFSWGNEMNVVVRTPNRERQIFNTKQSPFVPYMPRIL